jgi:hypothetical protein
MTAKDLNISFDDNFTGRIERMAARLKIKPEDFGLFSIIRCLEDFENLERIVVQPDLRAQLADTLELRRLGKLPIEDFAREVEELAAMPSDDAWTADA